MLNLLLLLIAAFALVFFQEGMPGDKWVKERMERRRNAEWNTTQREIEERVAKTANMTVQQYRSITNEVQHHKKDSM